MACLHFLESPLCNKQSLALRQHSCNTQHSWPWLHERFNSQLRPRIPVQYLPTRHHCVNEPPIAALKSSCATRKDHHVGCAHESAPMKRAMAQLHGDCIAECRLRKGLIATCSGKNKKCNTSSLHTDTKTHAMPSGVTSSQSLHCALT